MTLLDPVATVTAQPTQRRLVAVTTPRLELHVPTAVTRFRQLSAALPGTSVHYAVKANPHPDLLRALVAAGASFDVASPAEVRACLEAGARPDDLVYSNPIKLRADILESAGLGVRLFVVDSPEETRKVADAAAGTSVLCRIVTSGTRLGLAALAQVRLLDRRGRDRPAARRGAGPRPGRGVLPRRLPAARPVGLGRPDRGILTGLRRAAPPRGCRRGCSTWAAASRPRSRAARPRSTPTATPSPAP